MRATTNTPDPLAGHTLIIDTREKRPLRFAPTIRTIRRTLQTADYTVDGWQWAFAIERKSVPDLVNSLTTERARFTREMERMASIAFTRVIVEGSYQQVVNYIKTARRATPAAILGSIAAFEVRYDTPFVFAADPREAAERVATWARHFVRHRECYGIADDLPVPTHTHIDVDEIGNRPPSPYAVD